MITESEYYEACRSWRRVLIVFIKKIEKEAIKKFVFILRRPDGSEYEKIVFASNKIEAEQRLYNMAYITKSRDEIAGLKRQASEN